MTVPPQSSQVESNIGVTNKTKVATKAGALLEPAIAAAPDGS